MSLLAVEGLRPLLDARARLGGVVQPVVKAVAAAVTLGTGASLGPEVPPTQDAAWSRCSHDNYF